MWGRKLFDIPGSYNFEYFPSRLMVDRYLNKGFSLEAAMLFNTYKGNTIVNNTPGVAGFLVNLDISGKYSFSRHMGNAKWLDPYIALGLGASFRTDGTADPFVPSTNLNLGCNFWFGRTKSWGAQIQTSGKLALFPGIPFNGANYIQHSVGVVYRFTPGKRSKGNRDKPRYPWTKDKQKFKRGKNS